MKTSTLQSWTKKVVLVFLLMQTVRFNLANPIQPNGETVTPDPPTTDPPTTDPTTSTEQTTTNPTTSSEPTSTDLTTSSEPTSTDPTTSTQSTDPTTSTESTDPTTSTEPTTTDPTTSTEPTTTDSTTSTELITTNPSTTTSTEPTTSTKPTTATSTEPTTPTSTEPTSTEPTTPTTTISTDPTTPRSTSITTTTAIPLIPGGESVEIVDQHAGRNEMKKYSFELPQEGANFHFELSEGQCIGFYSFSNDSPDESDNDGSLNIPGDTKIMPRSDLQQLNRKVFISVKGILDENVFSFSAEAVNDESSSPGFGIKIIPNFYVVMFIMAVFRLAILPLH